MACNITLKKPWFNAIPRGRFVSVKVFLPVGLTFAVISNRVYSP
jgi:hypothetical protein